MTKTKKTSKRNAKAAKTDSAIEVASLLEGSNRLRNADVVTETEPGRTSKWCWILKIAAIVAVVIVFCAFGVVVGIVSILGLYAANSNTSVANHTQSFAFSPTTPIIPSAATSSPRKRPSPKNPADRDRVRAEKSTPAPEEPPSDGGGQPDDKKMLEDKKSLKGKKKNAL